VANRFSSDFRTRAQAGDIPVAALEMTIAGTTYRYSDQPVASKSQGMFKPQVLDWGGAIVDAADDRNSSVEASSLSVTIADHDDTLSNLFFGVNRRAVFNSTAKIYLAYPDISFANWFTVFTGRIATKNMVEPKVWRIDFRFDDTSLAGETADFTLPVVDEKTFPTAPDESLGKKIPLIYGKRAWSSAGWNGDIEATYCSTDGDPADATNPHRFVVCIGHATKIPIIWADGTLKGSYAKDTDWFWTERNGIYFTEIGYAGAPNPGVTYSEPITCNVWGMSTDGDGSTTEADLITNPARQIENFLINFVFNRWRKDAWKTVGPLGSTPFDATSLTAIEDFFDDRGVVGSGVLRSGVALSVLNNWLKQHFCAAWWDEAGKLMFGVRNPYDSDIYLDNNTPANWPWFQSPIHGRGDRAIYPLAEDDRRTVERITMNVNLIDKDNCYSATKYLQDFRRTTMNAEEAINMSWGQAEYGSSHDIDAQARRLRRDRFSNMQLSINSSVAMMDPDLFDGVLISDPVAPHPSGTGWGNDAIWKPRLMSLVRRSFNLTTKEVACVLEDERFFRTTHFESGAGEINTIGAVKSSTGPYNGRASDSWTFTRGTAAWVPDLSGNIVKLSNVNVKRTSSGMLMEPKAQNYFYNPAFVAGWTNWTSAGAGTRSLDTAERLFEDETADDLSGTNQSAKLLTTAGGSVSSYQSTARTFSGSDTVAFSVWHKDSGNPLRIQIKNDTTGNWLTTAGGWSGSQQNASNFSTATDWTRDTIRFTMEATGSTLTVYAMSPTGTNNYSHVAHMQIEDNQHYGGLNPPDAVVTSVMVSGSGTSFTRNADSFYIANTSTSGRSFEYWNQGTFRCIWKPILSGSDVANGTRAYIFDVVDAGAGNAHKLDFFYEGTAVGRFRVGWSGAANATLSIQVNPIYEYKCIIRWIGSNKELDYLQGRLSMFIYDPSTSTWYNANYNGTQPSSVTNSNYYLGCAPGFHGYGYFSDVEVVPFALTDEECKDYP
jgi:hypothetical protein